MSETTEEPSEHDKVQAFADGELAPEEAAQFRIHLVGCEQCQGELREIMVMAGLTQTLVATEQGKKPGAEAQTEAEAGLATVIRLRPRRRRTLIVVASTGLAAAAALTAYYALPPRPVEIAMATTRPLEARLSWSGADRWRPYEVMRAAGGTHEAVPLEAMAKLERRGEVRGVAAGWLLAGEPERAAGYLERAGDSADADSDRAVVALARGQREEALTLLDRALQRAPRHGQARWNRALVLQQLHLTAAAAHAFDEVAALGESGWADEARKRAQALRAADAAAPRAAPEACARALAPSALARACAEETALRGAH